MRKKITPYILPVGLYAMVIVLVFGSALFPPDGYLLYGDDIHRAYYFFRQFFNSFLKEGIFPWWNPYNFSGTPFIADPITNIWYPPTWLFVFLPLNVAYSWHVALHILWAMVGMYVLISNLKFKISNLSAWVGGLIFGLSGFFMARTWAGHVDVIAAASWMPWVVAAFAANLKFKISNLKLENQVNKQVQRRLIIIASLALAAQLLAGYHTMAFFTMEIVGLMSLYSSVRQRTLTPAFRALLAVLLAIGLAAIQLVPEMEFLRQSIRSYALPYSWASYGSMTWESLRQLFSPFYFGNQLTYHGPPPNIIEHAAFIGRVGLGLAIFGLLGGRKYLFFAVVAFLGLWVSLGPNAPIDLQKILWTLIPIYHSLRIPPRHLVLFVFGASALAGIGLQTILSKLSKLSKAYFHIPVGISKYALNFSHIIGVAIAFLVLAEMVPFAQSFVELRPIPETREDKELIQILRHDTGNQSIKPYRILQNFGVWIPQREALEFDVTMSKGIFSATGYDISILKSYYEFIDKAAGNTGSSILKQDVQVPYFNAYAKALDFLNIKYIMVPRGYDPFVGMKLLREDPVRDYRLYENTTVLPRFYFPDHSAPTITKYTPNEIMLTSNYSSSATLMSSEVYYPGWEAFIDGKKTTIIKRDAFRTLFVPGGSHEIRFQFVPYSFYVGLVVSLGTGMIFILWWRRK